jgi:hypothetical protein
LAGILAVGPHSPAVMKYLDSIYGAYLLSVDRIGQGLGLYHETDLLAPLGHEILGAKIEIIWKLSKVATFAGTPLCEFLLEWDNSDMIQ